MVEEFAEGGSLYNYRKTKSGMKFSEKAVSNYIKQIAEALIYIHS